MDHNRGLSTSLNSHTRPDSLWNCWRVQQLKLLSPCRSVQVELPPPHRYDPINQIFVKTSSNVKQRGGFLSLYALILSLGILTTYCLGALLYWRFVSIIPPFINFLLFLALWRIPESPLWLLSNRGTEDCREALQWLRYSDHIIIM